MNVSRKVVAGYHKGITGPTCVTGADTANETYHTEAVDLKIYQWPVSYADDSYEVAFWVNECYDSKDNEQEVIQRVIAKAEKLAEIYNKSVE